MKQAAEQTRESGRRESSPFQKSKIHQRIAQKLEPHSLLIEDVEDSRENAQNEADVTPETVKLTSQLKVKCMPESLVG